MLTCAHEISNEIVAFWPISGKFRPKPANDPNMGFSWPAATTESRTAIKKFTHLSSTGKDQSASKVSKNNILQNFAQKLRVTQVAQQKYIFFLMLRDLKVLSEGRAAVVGNKWVFSGCQEQLWSTLCNIISQYMSVIWMPEGWNRDKICGKFSI